MALPRGSEAATLKRSLSGFVVTPFEGFDRVRLLTVQGEGYRVRPAHGQWLDFPIRVSAGGE